jgi:hypothetical protein
MLDSKDPGKAQTAALVGGAAGGIGAPAVEGVIAAGRAVGTPVGGKARGLFDPDGEAARRVAGALRADFQANGENFTREQVGEALGRGQTIVIGDLGGGTTRSLARSAANTSPEARMALQDATGDRFATQATRTGDFVEGLGSGTASVDIRDQLQSQARRANRTAYGEFYRATDGGVWNDDFAQLATAPDVADVAM